MTESKGKILTVNLIQTDIVWEDVEANLQNIEFLIDRHPQKSDLYILPETFSTGFTMQTEKFAVPESGGAVQWMIEHARIMDAMFMGSVIIEEDGKYFNRLYCISKEGIEGFYDKRHLFRMGREHDFYTPGEERKVITFRGFRILPLICYDIRFPVFSRNRNDYDILLYVANWPAPRQHVWTVLLQARAIENQAYVLGVNRVGLDGEGVDHLGETSVINLIGKKTAGLANKPGLLYYEIPLNEIVNFRRKFPAWKDADDFRIYTE